MNRRIVSSIYQHPCTKDLFTFYFLVVCLIRNEHVASRKWAIIGNRIELIFSSILLFWCVILWNFDLLAQNVIQIPSRWRYSSVPSGAAQGHQFIRRIGLLHVRPVGMIEHFPGFFPGSLKGKLLDPGIPFRGINPYFSSFRSLCDILCVGTDGILSAVATQPDKTTDRATYCSRKHQNPFNVRILFDYLNKTPFLFLKTLSEWSPEHKHHQIRSIFHGTK